jgi:hypothetical protein
MVDGTAMTLGFKAANIIISPFQPSVGWTMSEESISLYQKRIQIILARSKDVSAISKPAILVLGVCRLFSVALAALGTAQRTESGGAVRFAGAAFLHFRSDHSGAGHFLAGRGADHFRDPAVFRDRHGRAGLVRLFLFSNLWTDLFMMVEQWVQGERPARMRLDKSPWNREKLIKKGGPTVYGC